MDVPKAVNVRVVLIDTLCQPRPYVIQQGDYEYNINTGFNTRIDSESFTFSGAHGRIQSEPFHCLPNRVTIHSGASFGSLTR